MTGHQASTVAGRPVISTAEQRLAQAPADLPGDRAGGWHRTSCPVMGRGVAMSSTSSPERSTASEGDTS